MSKYYERLKGLTKELARPEFAALAQYFKPVVELMPKTIQLEMSTLIRIYTWQYFKCFQRPSENNGEVEKKVDEATSSTCEVENEDEVENENKSQVVVARAHTEVQSGSRFGTLTGKEADVDEVLKVLFFIDIDKVEDIEQRKRVAEYLVKECQEHECI